MDGQTDMMKLTVTFCNFVNTPKRMAANEVTNSNRCLLHMKRNISKQVNMAYLIVFL